MSVWDINPYDLEELELEAESKQEVYHLVTGDQSITLGINEVNRYDYEIWLERDGAKIEHFLNFDDLDDYINDQYPDVDWEK